MGLVATSAPPALAGSGGFSNTGSMNVARIDHTATLLSNGEVLVAGGNNNRDGYLSSAEVYHPSSGKWTLTGSMTVPRDGHDPVLFQNSGVFVVGNDDIYNPSAGPWSSTTPPPTFAHIPLALLPNGDVFAAGTIQGDLMFNPSTAQWTNFAPPPCETTRQGCESAAALLNTGKVLVAGGATFVNARPYPIEETNGLAALFPTSTT